MHSSPACARGVARAIMIALGPLAPGAFAAGVAQQIPSGPAPDARMYQASNWIRFDTSSGLPSADVHQIVEVEGGRVWAATAEGLAVYDGFRWRKIEATSGLPPGRPRQLTAAGGGRVFVTTRPSVFVGDENGFEEIVPPEGIERFVDALPVPGGDLLLQGEGEGSLALEWRLLSRLDQSLQGGPRPPSGMLEADAVGRDAWFLDESSLQRWDGSNWVPVATVPAGVPPYRYAIHSREELGFFYSERPLQTRGIWEWSPDGRSAPVRLGDERVLQLDVGSNGDAYAVYRDGRVVTRQAGTWSEIDPPPHEMYGVNVLRSRPRGQLWSATEGGLFLYRPVHPYWSSVELGEGRGAIVLETLRVSSGDTWLGTGAGLARLSPQGAVERVEHLGGRELAAITGLAEDADGALWVGSGSGSFEGVWRLADGAWQHFGEAQGLPLSAVHRIRVDRRGRPWFLGIAPDSGGPEPGAFALDEHGFQPWSTREGLAGDRVYDFVDSGDAYWFATVAGISRWRRGEWTHWTSAQGLGVDLVYALAVDEQGRVWFGHGKSGFGLGVIENEEVRYIGPDGTSLDVSFLAVGEGCLWVGSETRGLSAYADGEWTEYGLAKGLSNRRLSALGLHDAGLLVGSLFGGLDILELDPVGYRAPRVQLEEPVVDGSRVHLRWRVSTHWQIADPDRVEVRHRIDGVGWSPWTRARELTTQSLDYGDHALELEVRDFFGRAIAVPGPRPFHVPPPLHRQARFFLPIGIAVLLLVVACGSLFARSRREGAALRESEERFRQLAENIREVFWLADSKTLRVLYVSPAYESAWGFPAHELEEHSTGWGDAIHAQDRERVLGSLALAGEHLFDEEYRIVLPDGSVRWVHDRAYPIHDMSGEVYRLAGVAEDVTEEHRSAERQHLLTRELDHRVKNNLAGVIALAQQTIARSTDLSTFEPAFIGRLHAMARAHEALAAARWTGVSLNEIVQSVLGSFAATEGPRPAGRAVGTGRVTIVGPDLVVGPAAALPLSGALHELATNAAKYGALQTPGGRVSVEWSDLGRVVRIEWAEAGGPPVETPHRAGTGTSLIRGLVEYELSGSVEFRFRPQGLLCAIEVPLRALRGAQVHDERELGASLMSRPG